MAFGWKYNRCLRRNLSRDSKNSSRGGVLLELAIVIPFVFLPLISGIVDYSLGFQDQMVRLQAARAGARSASRLSDGSTGDQLRDSAKNAARAYLAGLNLNPDMFHVNVRSIVYAISGTSNANAIEVVVSRVAPPPFSFIGRGSFRGCARSLFRLNTSTTVTEVIADANC